jgi:hypothetical protein
MAAQELDWERGPTNNHDDDGRKVVEDGRGNPAPRSGAVALGASTVFAGAPFSSSIEQMPTT